MVPTQRLFASQSLSTTVVVYGGGGGTSACVEQLLTRALQEVADGALGDPILEMGIDAAEGELLSSFVAGLFEGVVLEAAIVAMVVALSSRRAQRRMSQSRVWLREFPRKSRRFEGGRSAGG
jgi:hypothetical protein